MMINMGLARTRLRLRMSWLRLQRSGNDVSGVGSLIGSVSLISNGDVILDVSSNVHLGLNNKLRLEIKFRQWL